MTPPNPRPRGLSLVPAHLMWVRQAVVGRIERRNGLPKGDWKLRCIALQCITTSPHYVWVGCVVIGRNSTTLLAPRLSVAQPLFWGSNRPPPPFSPGKAGRPVGPWLCRCRFIMARLSVCPRTSSLLFWTASADRRCEPRREPLWGLMVVVVIVDFVVLVCFRRVRMLGMGSQRNP